MAVTMAQAPGAPVGFSAQLGAFMAAIRSMESGGGNPAGDYSITNSAGCKGAYQFCPGTDMYQRASAGGWTKQAQDRVAADQMTAYYRQFGSWEKVARAWLGGPGSVNNPGAADSNGTTVGGYGQTAVSRQQALLQNPNATFGGATATTASDSSGQGGPYGSTEPCLLSSPSFVGVGGGCLLSTASARALAGAGLLTAGGVLVLVGVAVVVATGLKGSPVAKAAAPFVGAYEGVRRGQRRSTSRARSSGSAGASGGDNAFEAGRQRGRADAAGESGERREGFRDPSPSELQAAEARRRQRKQKAA